MEHTGEKENAIADELYLVGAGQLTSRLTRPSLRESRADISQESYFTYGDEKPPVDHDVHWRQGLGAAGEETFLPRTLVYDFRGSFGALNKSNPLYDEGGEPATDAW